MSVKERRLQFIIRNNRVKVIKKIKKLHGLYVWYIFAFHRTFTSLFCFWPSFHASFSLTHLSCFLSFIVPLRPLLCSTVSLADSSPPIRGPDETQRALTFLLTVRPLSVTTHQLHCCLRCAHVRTHAGIGTYKHVQDTTCTNGPQKSKFWHIVF